MFSKSKDFTEYKFKVKTLSKNRQKHRIHYNREKITINLSIWPFNEIQRAKCSIGQQPKFDRSGSTLLCFVNVSGSICNFARKPTDLFKIKYIFYDQLMLSGNVQK